MCSGLATLRGADDAGYGTHSDLRTNITALGLNYVAGMQPQTSVWAHGTGPQPPKNWSGHGRPSKLRREASINPISVKKLALGLPTQKHIQCRARNARAAISSPVVAAAIDRMSAAC
jgi:hypothetical protein